MKFLKLLRILPVALPLFVTACASLQNQAMLPNSEADRAKPRFRDTKATDLVLEYYRPDTIYMKRPDAHEGQFLTIFSLDNIVSEIEQRVTERDLAVVVIGQFYDLDKQAAVIHNWEATLNSCGFNRVVVLRAGTRSANLDGLPILGDSIAANTPVAKPIAGISLAQSSVPIPAPAR